MADKEEDSVETTTNMASIGSKEYYCGGSEDRLSYRQLVVIEEKARSIILLSLFDHINTEVVDQATTSELWLNLESLYMTTSITNRLLLK